MPLGVALDLHANVTARMVEAADVIVGFKTYPHVDMVETGAHVARLVGRMLDEGVRPHQVWCHPPQLAHTLRMDTRVAGAMADLVEASRVMETKPGILAATLFGGFGLADLPEAGASIVVVAESATQAQGAAKELGAALWARRAEFVYDEAPSWIPSPRRVQPPNGRGSGRSCSSTTAITACRGDLRRDGCARRLYGGGLDGVVAGPICDPECVAALFAAGTGAAAEIRLGNKVALPGFTRRAPLALTGRVAALGDGGYIVTGPTYTGQRFTMGRAAVLDTGRARVLVSEEPHEPWDLAIFTGVGIDTREARFLILKSRMYCRPVFEPIARAVVECASAGVTSLRLPQVPLCQDRPPDLPDRPGGYVDRLKNTEDVGRAPAPIRRIKLSDQIADDLCGRIARERMVPGQRLPNEQTLMQHYGCSKGTIREALKALEVQGLVTMRPGPSGGAEIRPVSIDAAAQQLRRFLHFRRLDFAQVYAVRRSLEVALGAGVVGRLDSDALQRLEENIVACEVAFAAGEHKRGRDLELTFHDLLCDASDNALLAFMCRFINSLLRDLVEFQRGSATEYAAFGAHNLDSHRQLVSAFRAEDGEAVSRVMHEHMCCAEHFMRRLDASFRSDLLSGR
ncbi:M81 family metallopeptidase [Methylobacterium sp. P31]